MFLDAGAWLAYLDGMEHGKHAEICRAVADVFERYNVGGPTHDNSGDRVVFARQVVQLLFFSPPGETAFGDLFAMVIAHSQHLPPGVRGILARNVAVDILIAWVASSGGGLRAAHMRSMGTASAFERFGGDVIAGVNADTAARKAGGTGRPGR